MKNLILTAITVLLISSCGGGGGGSSGGNAGTQKPNAPSNVTASSSGSIVTLTWDMQAGTQYDVYYASDKDIQANGYAVYENAGLVVNATSPLVLSSLATAKAYYFVVKAKASGVESASSTKAWAVTRYTYAGAHSELVIDNVSGLTWERCLFGQTWNNASKTCDGAATQLNETQAYNMKTPGPDGWRLASPSELGTLAFCNSEVVPYFRPQATLPGGDADCAMANEKWGVMMDVFPSPVTDKSLYTSDIYYDSGISSWLYGRIFLGATVVSTYAGGTGQTGYVLRVKTT